MVTSQEIVRRMVSADPLFPAWAGQFIVDGTRAEVLMVAQDTRGDVWLHQKGEWRLPTGTLKAGEDARSCLSREVAEEFGQSLPIIAMLGMLRLELAVPTVSGAFRSHIFFLDAGEGITGWRTVPIGQLRAEAARLRALQPTTESDGWRRPFWGAFRALEHEIVADLLLARRAACSRGIEPSACSNSSV